jgi:hypothetical protein
MADKKSSLKKVMASVWVGICLGVASTVLVVEFSVRALPNPLEVALLTVGLDTVLLVCGLIGFSISKRVAR